MCSHKSVTIILNLGLPDIITTDIKILCSVTSFSDLQDGQGKWTESDSGTSHVVRKGGNALIAENLK